MAQIVKLEPGDILVLANLGAGPQSAEEAREIARGLRRLKKNLRLGSVLLFEGDVDLSVLPAGWTPDAVAGG